MSRVDQITGPYYCQTALQLCIVARRLCVNGECGKVSEICAFVSTICPESVFETCNKESNLCEQVAKYCLGGKNSENCKKARVLCTEARKLCPQNNIIAGI